MTRQEDGSKEVREGLPADLAARVVGDPALGAPATVRLDVTGAAADGSLVSPGAGEVRVMRGAGDAAEVLAQGRPGEEIAVEGLGLGEHDLRLEWDGSGVWRGGSADVALTVSRASADLVSPRHRLTPARQGRRHGVLVVRSTNPAVDATGRVVVRAAGRRVGTGVLDEGERRLRVRVARVAADARSFTVKYRGDDQVAPERFSVAIDR